MTGTALCFPGQGSQRPGMLDPFAEAWPGIRERVEELGGPELASLVFEADAAELRDPANTQPAVLATGVVAAEALAKRASLEPDVVAGHSLGHVSAATTAGIFDAEAAIELVRARGELMAAAERSAGPGTMVAVLLAEPHAVREVVAEVEGASLAAVNAPRQTVVSGRVEAVETAVGRLESSLDRVRTVELDVGSGFHSPVMAPAVEPFRDRLAETDPADPAVPVVSDVTGRAYEDAGTGLADLAEQLRSPVRWRDVVETLSGRGVERFVVAPPAEELAGLIERTADGRVVPVDRPGALEEVVPSG